MFLPVRFCVCVCMYKYTHTQSHTHASMWSYSNTHTAKGTGIYITYNNCMKRVKTELCGLALFSIIKSQDKENPTIFQRLQLCHPQNLTPYYKQTKRRRQSLKCLHTHFAKGNVHPPSLFKCNRFCFVFSSLELLPKIEFQDSFG